MSLHSTRPLSQAELLPALEAALRLQDLALVESHGTYSVVPLKSATHRIPGIQSYSNRPGFSIQVVALQFISAVEMEKILEPLAPTGAVVRVDEARNLLLLAGTSQEQASMLEFIKTFDVDWLAGMSYAMFGLSYVDAKTAVAELSEIFADPKSPLAGVVRLVPLTRLNSILVITPQEKYLTAVQSWIKRLDIGGTSAGRRIYVYDVQNGKAEDLATSLNSILSLSGGDSTGQQPASSNAFSNSGGGTGFGSASSSSFGGGNSYGNGNSYGGSTSSGMGGGGLSTATGSSSFGRATTASSGGSGTGTGRNALETGSLRIVPDTGGNALLILATPTEFSMISAALQRLDAPNRQVLIEASLAEVTLTDDLRYGVQWSYQSSSGPVVLSSTATGQIAQTFPGFSYLYTGATNIRAALSALESITKVRVVSSPKLVTLNNHEAELQVGDEVPVTTQSAVSVSTPDAPIVNSVTYRDTGVILRVTPRVNKNGLVQLDIAQEVSDVAPTTTSGVDSPTIQQRKLTSTVVVKNGDTIALGGLIRDNVSETKSGVPILSRIPVLGGLFRDTDHAKNRTELILLITPRVMRDDSEFQDVMDDLRNEFRVLKPVFKPDAKKR